MDADRQRRSQWGLLLVLAVAGVHIWGLHAPFVYDDLEAIVNNPRIRTLWPLAGALHDPRDTALSGRPVVGLSLALNHAIGGLNVVGYHAFNIAVHGAASLLLLGLLGRLFVRPPVARLLGPRAVDQAGVIGMLWAVHPLHTETVACVILRTELLAGLFCLLTVYAAVRAWSSPNPRRWLAMSAGACALAMGSKEVAAAAPLLVLLVDRALFSGSARKALSRRRAYYGLLASTWLVLLGLLLAGARARSLLADQAVGAWPYLWTQAGVLAHYLRLCVWPWPLTIAYDWPVSGGWLEVWPAMLLVGSLAVLSVVALLVKSPMGLAGAWFFLILAPSSSVVPIAQEIVAERRMYLPLAAVLALLVCGCVAGWHRWIVGFRGFRGSARLGLSCAVAAALVLAVLSVRRLLDYRDAQTLWQAAVAVSPRSATARNNLGWYLLMGGDSDGGLAELRMAVRLQPHRPEIHVNLGAALAQRGELGAARAHFETALALEPDLAAAHLNLGLLLAREGRLEAAGAHLDRAARLEPGNVAALFEHALACRELGDIEQARRSAEVALELDRSHGGARRLLDELEAAGR